MKETASSFIAKSTVKAADKEHRRKINFNIGKYNAVVPQGELRNKANDAAIALSKRPAGSLRETKRLMRDQQRITAQIAEEGQLFKERLKTAEAREALAAFAERRPANFARLSA